MRIRLISRSEDTMLVMNHSIKWDQTPEDHPTHIHTVGYELLFLKKGDILYEVGDQKIPLRKHALVFTRPNVPHKITPLSGEAYDRVNLIISPELFPPEILAKIPEDQHVFLFEGNQLVPGLFEKMDYYCSVLSGASRRQLIRSLTGELLWNLYIQLDQPDQSRPKFHHPLTRSILAYMEERITEPLSADRICEDLGISKSYLHQIFQEDLNTTPKAWLTQRRLKLARQEIFLGAKATAIYSFCGFQDYSAFYRAYKKQFGYTPAETLACAFQEASERK